MNFGIYSGEHQLSDVVKRLFQLEGPGADELTKKAEAALLHVNPHLRDLSQVPKGMVIVIPKLVGVEFAKDTELMEAPLKELVETVRHELKNSGKSHFEMLDQGLQDFLKRFF